MPGTVVVLIALGTFLAGFLLGWLIEWWLDLVRWRRVRESGGTIQGLSENEEVGAEYIRTMAALLERREEEIRHLRDELDAQEERYRALQEAFERYMATHPDDLTAIKGIGRIYQWKLRDAGINSYAQLASTSVDRLRKIIDAPAWRRLDLESWIEQARSLAQRG